jgi:hypothetical protein
MIHFAHLHKRTVSFAVDAFLVFSALTATAQDIDLLKSGFREPPHESGIRAFWWWLNGNVTKDAITRDLEEMKAKGYNGAMIFDADGSGQRGNERVPAGPLFASDAWTELFVHACEEARRLNLELSLNIQSGWNLGGPNVTPAETTQQLTFSETPVEGAGVIEKNLKQPVAVREFYRDVAVIALPLPAQDNPNGIEPGAVRPISKLKLKAATRELGMSAPDARYLLETSPAQPGEIAIKRDHIRILSDQMDESGTLRWDVPEGRWVVLRVGHTATGSHVSTSSGKWQGSTLDYMNPDALRNYWQRNIDPIFRAIGPRAGTTLAYVHTDSWEGGGMNWTPGFEEAFKANRGYDPIPWLAVMAGYVLESREDSNAFLADLRKTIGDRVAGHYELLGELADGYGMGTHPECSGPHAGPLDGLKNYGRSDLMMSEFWAPSPHRPNPPNRFFVKQASSAAHTYGARLVGAEGFTTIGTHWNVVPWSDMKSSFDHEIAEGLNLLFNHTFTCSPEEMGIPGQEYFAGTHFNPQITWWDQAPTVIDYFRRCQYLAQQGDFVADVVYYYGDHIPNIARRKRDDPAGALPGFDYDVLSEELLLSSLETSDGKLTLPSGMVYRLLVLPDHRVLSLGALKKVDQLVRAGATVLGPKPRHAVSLEGGEKGKALFKKLADGLWGAEYEPDSQGVRGAGRGRVVWGTDAQAFLRSDGVAPDVEFRNVSSEDMAWIHYRIGDAEVYFIAEQGGKPVDFEAVFRSAGRVPELWNAEDGSIREANTFRFAEGRTHIPLKLRPYESAFVVFRKAAASGRNAGPNTPEWENLARIDGPWQVAFDPDWGGPGEPVRFAVLESWTQRDEPGVKYYSGKARYRTTFHYDPSAVAEGRRLAVELGNVADLGIAQVFVNGKDLGLVWRPPFRADITDMVKPGENLLEVDVVNSWRNRLVRDKDLPEDERFTRTNIRVTWDLSQSGLMGPVRLTTSE